MRVLLIEDDPTTSKSIELMLTHANLNVYATDLGEEGIDLAKLYDYDLILLDDKLPDISGHDVLKRLRLSRIETPILMLAGCDKTESKIKAFGYGADDYLTKPFHREELVARIHTIIRRSKSHSQAMISTGQLTINLDAKTVIRTDPETKEISPLHLTGKEYQMFELLSLRKGATLTKEMFLNHLYGGMDEPELKIIDVFICKLRKKVAEATDGQQMIETVWGRGYTLKEPDQSNDAEVSSDVVGVITGDFNGHPFQFGGAEVTVSVGIPALKEDGIAGGFHQAGFDAYLSLQKISWDRLPALRAVRPSV